MNLVFLTCLNMALTENIQVAQLRSSILEMFHLSPEINLTATGKLRKWYCNQWEWMSNNISQIAMECDYLTFLI